MTLTAERGAALQRAQRLEVASLAYNLIETFVGLAAGIAAASTALIAFGLDSVMESLSAGVLLWRLRSEATLRRTGEEAESRALRPVALAFLALAAYIGVTAVMDLVSRHQPEESSLGIALAAVSLVVMPWLALAKTRVATQLGSRTMHADSTQTWLCAALSGFLLLGLTANALLGLWWADPVSALGIGLIAANEGRELLMD